MVAVVVVVTVVVVLVVVVVVSSSGCIKITFIVMTINIKEGSYNHTVYSGIGLTSWK